MDYVQLLSQAQQNNRSTTSKPVRCYNTSFAPPKKLEKSKVPSENIKKYLARRDEEKQKKIIEEQKRKDELLALRNQDKKAKRRVQVMLKRTKSANKSVMEDAVDNENTADTLAGTTQCDEDDYGYVSQEASLFYNKLMAKYQNTPSDSVKFSNSVREVKDLNAAKKRVKDALIKEAEEEMLPHKRKRKHKDESDKNEEVEAPEVPEEKPQNEVKKRKMMPPPVNFQELLKLAEQKHKEPILVEVAPKDKSPERLMTQKEKMELMREKERRLGKIPKKEGRPSEVKPDKSSGKPPPSSKDSVKSSPPSKPKSEDEKSGKLKEKSVSEKLYKSSDVWNKSGSPNHAKNGVSSPRASVNKLNLGKPTSKPPPVPESKKLKNGDQKRNDVPSKSQEKPKVNLDELSEIDREIELLRRKRALLEKQKLLAKNGSESRPQVNNPSPKLPNTNNKLSSQVKSPIRPSPSGPSNAPNRMSAPPNRLPLPPNRPLKRNPLMKKKNNRVIDSESEYDSELDDFIEDDEEEDPDVSRHIKEIFGYDRAKYRDRDEDDECMESNFAEQMKEEFISTKIGIMEDLEDMRKEQEEKMRKKQRLKRS